MQGQLHLDKVELKCEMTDLLFFSIGEVRNKCQIHSNQIKKKWKWFPSKSRWIVYSVYHSLNLWVSQSFYAYWICVFRHRVNFLNCCCSIDMSADWLIEWRKECCPTVLHSKLKKDAGRSNPELFDQLHFPPKGFASYIFVRKSFGI